MATCALTTGFERYNCETTVGGVSELYLLPFSSFTSVAVTANEITGFTLVGTPTWYGFELNEEVGMMESSETKDLKNNSLFYETNLSFTLNKMEAVKANELALIALQRTVVIVKTNDGNYFCMGDLNGCHKAGGSNNASTGTSFGDLNGYGINMTEKSTHFPYQITGSVVLALTIDYNS